MTPAQAEGTYIITLPVIECRNCGLRTWRGCAVMGAVGHYCHDCAEIVAIFAKIHANRQMADMWASGVIRIPTEPYDPKPPAGLAALAEHEKGSSAPKQHRGDSDA